MNWVILIFAFILAVQCKGNQENKITTSILRQNLSEKSIRLDPLLRKALLRALTDLEKEATDRLRAEETRNIRSENNISEQNNNNIIGRVREQNQKSPADSILPTDLPNIEGSTVTVNENIIDNSPTTVENTFQYSTPLPLTSDVGNLGRESNRPESSNIQDISSNFISDEGNTKNKNLDHNSGPSEENSTEKSEDGSKSEQNANDVDIFKAPLVAAFTLHQDSKGTPHSVVPLFRPSVPNSQQLLEQQYALFKQQQQQQFFQNQFVPSIPFAPLPHTNQFDHSRFILPAGPSLSPSTIFPPLISNSVIGSSFPSTVIPPHSFQPTTVAPLSNQNFISTLPPQRPISPQPFPTTLLPPQDFNGISVVPSHSLNFSPTPQPNIPLPTIPPTPGLQPISIPPVTLPLQNEPRFQSPIIVPSFQINSNQAFLENQEQQRIRNQLLLNEENRKRQLEEQNRQRQIEVQHRQKLFEEQNRQRLLEEQNKQRQLAEEKQKQFLEQNLRQNPQDQFRQQRQEQGVDFQRSVGFSYNQNLQNPFNSHFRTPNNAFNFHIQPSQSFVSSVNFQVPNNKNRVNREEAFGSTGNFGLANNQGQRNFAAQTQFQSNQALPPIIGPAYRTIPDEHYRNLPINQIQENRYSQLLYQQQQQQQQQQLQQLNSFRQNNVEDVNKKLKNLLYQSGVAIGGSGQEDLNIVSKVLALNHQRSDTNADDTVLTNERRADFNSDKGLGVGEIKDEQEKTS